jgi:hypothetical protein
MPILFWGAFFGFLGSIFVSIAKVVVEVVGVIVPIIVRVFTALGGVLVRVGRAFGDFARTIARGAKAFVDHVVKPVIKAVSDAFGKLARFFDRVTAPIKAVLERVNRALDWVWSRVIAPILDAIQRIRAVLKLLAALGADWARKLDEILAQIETRIYDTFREVRNWVNTFELWLDLLLHPGGWIRSFPFLYTVFKWQGNIMGILVNLGLDPHAKERVDLVRADHPQLPVTETVTRFNSRYYADHWGVQSAIARLKTRTTFRG